MNKKLLNAKSPSGIVHAVSDEEDGEVRSVCNINNYNRGSYGVGFYHKWERTSEPVTCKTCLKSLGIIKYVPVRVKND